MDVWKRVLSDVELDVALVHNHHTLLDVRAFELVPLAAMRGVGIVNAAPFASGLLTGKPPPAWHPAPAEARR
jgi:aryl-alcohol dehydrogenase-like predicted oxidoreductase